MHAFLVFRLYGPLSAWGDVAVGEVRPVQLHPGRSALLGLIAAALGIRRDEPARQQELAQSLRFAVRIDASGTALRDYHTAQVLPARRLGVASTRADELRAPRDELSTILSWRDYRCDAAYTVAVWVSAASTVRLDSIAAALDRPSFAPYLGRRACPLSLPLGPRQVEAPSITEALRAYEGPSWPAVNELSDQTAGRAVYWEAGDVPAGIEIEQRFVRRDEPLSRARWQFAVREELRGTMMEEGALMFFSKLVLSPDVHRQPAYWRMFDDPYRVHQAVWDLFADVPDRRRDFLYRIDVRGGRPTVLAVSQRKPTDSSGIWLASSKEYRPDVRAGDRLTFALRVNPTRCREGKRHDVVMDAKTRLAESGLPREAWPPMAELVQRECAGWIEARAPRLGIELESVRVDGLEVAEFRKRGAGRVRITMADIVGRLVVADAASFMEALLSGVGRAKGFGCGLMLCARA